MSVFHEYDAAMDEPTQLLIEARVKDRFVVHPQPMQALSALTCHLELQGSMLRSFGVYVAES